MRIELRYFVCFGEDTGRSLICTLYKMWNFSAHFKYELVDL